jgi:hypothetical protein
VFAQLVRMNDGEFHARHRPEVASHAGSFAALDVAEAGRGRHRDLLARSEPNALLSMIPVQPWHGCWACPIRTWTARWTWCTTSPKASRRAPARSGSRGRPRGTGLLQQGEREALPHARAAIASR